MKIEDRINTVSKYYKAKYGFRVFKLGLSTGIECPKRAEGSECYFCVRDTFTDDVVARHNASLPVQKQIDYMIQKLMPKVRAGGYIAYFQDGTSFYGEKDYLLSTFREADSHPQVLELIVSTRPDYISEELLDTLGQLKKPLTIEVGIQSANDGALLFLNRGHKHVDNQSAIEKLVKYNYKIGVHIMLGVPGERVEDVLKTAEFINENKRINDVKIHHLAVFRGSRLAEIMEPAHMIDLDSYIRLLSLFISNLREDLTVSRLFTSNLNRHQTMLNDFPGIKRMWLNRFEEYLNDNNVFQGKELKA